MKQIEDETEPRVILGPDEIQDILPHRPPFLLIDEICDLKPGKSAVALKHLLGSEDFFQGHFPGCPVMPGVLITEALAQTGACALLSLERYSGQTPLFAGIDRMRFRKLVIPGDSLRLEVVLQRMRGPVGKGDAIATVRGAIVADGILTFALSKAQEGTTS